MLDWFFHFVGNCFFLLQVSWIIFTEVARYQWFKKLDEFVDRLTLKLSSINILYVKTFQAFALNNSLIDDHVNSRLMKFTDSAPWSTSDIDYNVLARILHDYELVMENGLEPINSGMISLVFLASKREGEEGVNNEKKFIIKMKRRNIEEKLHVAIEKLLFCVQLLSFIPIFHKYQIADVIHKNVSIIQHQINFATEVFNMKTMKHNCRKLKYVVIPSVYEEVTEKYPNVIMMDYIQGMTINKIAMEDYEGFAKQVVKFGIVTTVIHGFAHGDLHAGNILFIKDAEEPNLKYKHKIGVLDFGIIYETDARFREVFFGLLGDMFTAPVKEVAERFLTSGLIEPLEIISNLPKHHHDNIISIMSNILNDVIHTSQGATQLKIYTFLSTFNSYMKDNKLTDLGLKPSDNFVKTQLSLAMSHGITLTLCKEEYMKVMDQVVNELFHTKLLEPN